MQFLNIAVVVGYLVLIVGVGTFFALKKKDAEGFMVAHQTMPGWAVGLSMFGSYISSISFLANPAQTFAGNWMFAAFTLVTPIGLWIGTSIFLKFYRRSHMVSAYSHLENRFGPWARTYAVFAYLILQMARTGTILFLLSQATVPLLGGQASDLGLARIIIVVVGVLITFYTLFGGIEAVVWTGVIQSIILVLGPVICLATILLKVPGGLGEIMSISVANDKFSMAPYTLDLAIPTFWLVVMGALLEHLRNWGIDQSYIQRYIAARSEKEAARGIWIAGLLYMPTAFVFWFIGTALFAYYKVLPSHLPAGTAPDGVFPHFIVFEVLPGLSGLVVAAIFAASMDSNLNSMATLTLMDGYKRYFRPHAGDRESLQVLWGSTLFWGAMSIGWGLFLTLKGATTTIQFSANIAGLLGGGVLGLFLLGLCSRRVTSWMAAVSVSVGVLLITWMTLSRIKVGTTAFWPQSWDGWKSPFHEMLAGPVGTVIIVLLGLVLALLFSRQRETDQQHESTLPSDEAPQLSAERSS
ncbi:sodium/glucose cotransporter [Abditibacteriota bacterium]|nr:sodium/glucose cotransporter [Abditibacteriota bacterium]